MRSALLCSAALLPLIGLGGCYLAHELGGAERDGGPRPDAPVTRDAGELDAGSDGGVVEPPGCVPSLVDERLVAVADEGSVQAPDLFWTGERLGVLAFHSNTVAHPRVVLTHVGPGLEDPAPLRRVGEESHSWGEAAWTGDAVGVCWNGDPGRLTALRLREVQGLDGRLGPRADFEPEDGPCLDLLFARGRYAMTWRYQLYGEDETIVQSSFGLFERDGTPASERLVLGSGPYPGRSPSMLDTGDGFVVVTPVDDALRILRLDAGGRVASERRLPAPGVTFAAAALREGRLGLLSLRGPRETRSLVLQILDEELRPLAERTIEDGAPTASYPRLLARPEGWVLVWTQGSRPSIRAMVMAVDPEGVPFAPRQVLHEGQSSSYGGPSLVSVDRSIFVALSHPPDDGGRERVYVQRWDCEEPTDDPCRPQRAHAGDCAGDRVWGWRWNGEACEPVIGCPSDCIGPDCGRLAPTRFACESDRRECPAPRDCRPAGAPALELCGPAELEANLSTRVRLGIEPTSCCEPLPTCRVRVTGPQALALELEQCGPPAPPCDCEPPDEPVDVGCVLPPMQPGSWQLAVPGREPVELTVRPPWEEASAEPVCR